MIERPQGAGGPGPAGGGGGGSAAPAARRSWCTYVQCPAPPPAPTPKPVAVVPPPVVKPPQPVRSAARGEAAGADAAARRSPRPRWKRQVDDATAPTPGTGGGTGRDGTDGNGPGAGGGVGSGIGTGRGSGTGPGTGGGVQANYAPTPTEMFIPPLPMPDKVRGFHLVAEYDVDETGKVLDFNFTPTRDGGYNKRLDDVLKSFKFRPGTTPDGTPDSHEGADHLRSWAVISAPTLANRGVRSYHYAIRRKCRAHEEFHGLFFCPCPQLTRTDTNR